MKSTPSNPKVLILKNKNHSTPDEFEILCRELITEDIGKTKHIIDRIGNLYVVRVLKSSMRFYKVNREE